MPTGEGHSWQTFVGHRYFAERCHQQATVADNVDSFGYLGEFMQILCQADDPGYEFCRPRRVSTESTDEFAWAGYNG